MANVRKYSIDGASGAKEVRMSSHINTSLEVQGMSSFLTQCRVPFSTHFKAPSQATMAAPPVPLDEPMLTVECGVCM